MQKLIKISYTHHIVVDNSEIKDTSYCFNLAHKIIVKPTDLEWANSNSNNLKKITHSTQPLEQDITYKGITKSPVYDYFIIKPLSLSEVEEAIYGYSVEKFLDNKLKQEIELGNIKPNETIMYSIGLEDGFKAHQEFVKDKLFTIKQLNEAIAEAWNSSEDNENNETYTQVYKRILKSLLPKTEWNIEFDEQGKIKLI